MLTYREPKFTGVAPPLGSGRPLDAFKVRAPDGSEVEMSHGGSNQGQSRVSEPLGGTTRSWPTKIGGLRCRIGIASRIGGGLTPEWFWGIYRAYLFEDRYQGLVDAIPAREGSQQYPTVHGHVSIRAACGRRGGEDADQCERGGEEGYTHDAEGGVYRSWDGTQADAFRRITEARRSPLGHREGWRVM